MLTGLRIHLSESEGLFPHLVVFRLPQGSNEWRPTFSWIGVSQAVRTLGLSLFRIRSQIGTAGLARISRQVHQLKASYPPLPAFPINPGRPRP